MTRVEALDIESMDLAENTVAASGVVVEHVELAEAANHSVGHRFDTGGVANFALEELGVASWRS